jgi:type VI secretion system secreted protein VgrG
MLAHAASLFQHYTQSTRMLRLRTPLADDTLLAECVRGEEGLSENYTFTISALSEDARLPLRSLIGQPALLLLRTLDGNGDRPFHGYLTATAFNGANGGMARYTLTLRPWCAFLEHGRDSRVFHARTVFDILDAVFRAWQGRGQLAPDWRFDIADRIVYPERSLTTQYQESDWAFAQRLMSEEGLFYYFEHLEDASSRSLGSHRLVIADHNGAFKFNTQRDVRFTCAGAVIREDSMDGWRHEARSLTNGIAIQSHDYRSGGDCLAASDGIRATTMRMISSDAPGHYAYPGHREGQRIADNQMKAFETRSERFVGAGTARQLSPGTRFNLLEHPCHDREDGADARRFIVTRVCHLMHNNLSAEMQAGVYQAIGRSHLAEVIAGEQKHSLHARGMQAGERPDYRNRIDAIRADVPYRSSSTDGHGVLLHPRPTVRGQQTAIVVGPAGTVVHTDRDHRVKVQFHWQRGSTSHTSHSRLVHPNPDGHTGAPADDTAGTWVRVMAGIASVAGTNWGGHAVPRVGQEVLVDFLDGDIDRPVIVGALYNGRGAADGQYNRTFCGPGSSTGNAPAWFPGDAGGHGHAAVLSGLKSQGMSTSQDGHGAYSQLVFDDSAGQARVSLQRHASGHKDSDELSLGYLRHQTDNQRLQPVGMGGELKTGHAAALRAGSGMLLSTESGRGAQMDARAALAQVRESESLQRTLAHSARKHNAVLKRGDGEAGAQEETLSAIEQLAHSAEVLGGGGSSGASASAQVTAYREPHLQLSGAKGIVAVTPASVVLSAGVTSSISAGQDINFAAQGNWHHIAAAGICLFTYGKASNGSKPNQEVGIKLHAASGKVSCHSQSDATRITADKAVTVASITKTVAVSAKTHCLLTAQGAMLKLEGGNIMLHAPGKVEFKATRKELSGPVSVPSVEIANKIQELNLKRDLQIEYVDADGNALTNEPIDLYFQGHESKTVELDSDGKATIKNAPLGPFRANQPRRK